MPRKPKPMETQRLSFYGSFINRIAPIEANIGIIKLSAVASASGITVNA
jgi:hypothetical protein